MIRIASYNLWNGATNTYFRLVDYVKEQNFDVLCLQEINGWESADLARVKEFADHTGFTDFEYGNSNSEYKLVIYSSLPITARTVHVEGFWHCAVEMHVHVDDREIVIINLHLDPWKEEPRLREVQRLLEQIDMTKPTVIMGDFNSISRRDNYPSAFLKGLQDKHITKFGQNELDFRVTDFLEEAGFVDAAASLNHMDTTVPSGYSTDEDHEVPARLDYAYVSSNLVPFLKDLATLKAPITNKISDHFPLVISLAFGAEPSEDNIDNHEMSEDKQAKPPEAVKASTVAQEHEETKNTTTEGEIKLH
jgi:exodeoxyribonuclease III